MHILIGPAATGIVHYLLLCFVAVFAGRGLVYLLRLRVEDRAELVFSAVVTLVFWTLVLGIAGGLRLPIRTITPWLWGGSLALASFGLVRRPRSYFSSSSLPICLCAALPLACMIDRVAAGLLESSASIANDGWIYMAGAQHVYDHGRTSYHGTNVIDQVGSYFQNHRFITFTMLGFLSPWGRAGDTTSVGSLLQAFSLFTFACAVQLFWTTQPVSRRLGLLGTAVTMLCGWTHTVIWGNWFENGLLLAYMPAMAATLFLWETRSWRRWLILGCESAALFYTFPEGSPAPLFLVTIVAAGQLWRERDSWAFWLAGTAAAVLIAIVLLAPALGTLYRFAAVAHTGRIWRVRDPSQNTALLRGMWDLDSYPGVFWALGGETWGTHPSSSSNVLGLILSVAALIGLVELARRGQWAFAAGTACLAGASVWWIAYFHNHYIAFKVLSVSWWCLAVAVTMGASWLCGRLSGRSGRVLLGGCAAVGLLAVRLPGLQTETPFVSSGYTDEPLQTFRQVRKIAKLVGGRTVIVDVDDWLANSLAAYYLRDCSLCVVPPRHWLSHKGIDRYRETRLRPAMTSTYFVLLEKARRTSESLDDLARYGKCVWCNDVFDLLRIDGSRVRAPTLLHMEPQIGGGRDQTGGKCFWVGDEAVNLSVWAPRAGTLKLSATFFSGTAEGNRESRTLALSAGVPAKAAKGYVDAWAPKKLRRESRYLGYRAHLIMRPGPGEISVPVNFGLNRITLRCVGEPIDDGDPAAHLLRLGVMGMKMSITPAAETPSSSTELANVR